MAKVIHHNQERSAKSASRRYSMARAMGQRASCGRELVVPYGTQQVLRSVYSDTGRDRVAVALQNRFIPEDCHCVEGGVAGSGGGVPGVDFCPSAEMTLFTDAPNPLYTNGLVIPTPPYSVFTGTTSRGMTIDLNSGVKSFRKTINNFASGLNSWSMYMFQGGFNSTPCGVWVEAQFRGTLGGSHDAAGLCIGMDTTPTTNYNWIEWTIGRVNGAGAENFSRRTAVGARTTIGPAAVPAATQIMRLELLGRGALVKMIRLDSSRATVSELAVGIAPANRPPGFHVGFLGAGTGGSGGGSTANAYWTNFAFGLI